MTGEVLGYTLTLLFLRAQRSFPLWGKNSVKILKVNNFQNESCKASRQPGASTFFTELGDAWNSWFWMRAIVYICLAS